MLRRSGAGKFYIRWRAVARLMETHDSSSSIAIATPVLAQQFHQHHPFPCKASKDFIFPLLQPSTMHFTHSVSGLVSGLLFATCAVAVPPLLQPIEARQGNCNTPTNRACWSDGFDITTDYDKETPQGSKKTVRSTITCNAGGHSADLSSAGRSPNTMNGRGLMATSRRKSCSSTE